jgi:hypothetical protein
MISLQVGEYVISQMGESMNSGAKCSGAYDITVEETHKLEQKWR